MKVINTIGSEHFYNRIYKIQIKLIYEFKVKCNANSLVLRMQSTDTFNFKQVVKTWKQKPQIFIVNVKLYMHRIQSTTTFLKYIQFKCVNLYLYQ